MTTRYFFIEPIDLLAFRGNRLFGDEGTFGETSVVPPPSVFAGAFRSHLLSQMSPQQQDEFRKGNRPDCPEGEQLGTYREPGTFRLRWLSLGRKRADGGSDVVFELLVPTPSDVAVSTLSDKAAGDAAAEGAGTGAEAYVADLISPPPEVACSSAVTGSLSAIARASRVKSSGGYLSQQGYKSYLAGEDSLETVSPNEIYTYDDRVGIALDLDTRTAEEGKIYSARFLRLRKDTGCSVGYVVGIAGAEALNSRGAIRLGGEGKAAFFEEIAADTVSRIMPRADYSRIMETRRFKIILLTAGVFTKGWIPDMFKPTNSGGPGDLDGTGSTGGAGGQGGWVLNYEGIRARLISLSLPRPNTISGWDMYKGKPKPALRVAHAGSVYYLELEEGSEDDLQKLDNHLACPTPGNSSSVNLDLRSRSIEGFGIARLGAMGTGKSQEHAQQEQLQQERK